ncbi:hypothetical protein [Croceibacterium aestuarii]|uniref:hypothetical protein n=1 Tax=Croceibacterium aestuarii TaxID=3064139 RepID=UPI00272DFE48|nr:hypothetical protein [Croceibacterium sp. D39]
MSLTLKQTEVAPDEWPAVEGVTGDALAIAWQRVEHYIAYRFAEREVVWRVDSDGCEWRAPLAPIVSLTAQEGEEAAAAPEAGAMGGWVLPCGQVTVTAQVGAGPVPEAVAEAVRRYAAFVAKLDETGAPPPGVTRIASGDISLSFRLEDRALGMAMVNSGAADLLRPYRRA